MVWWLLVFLAASLLFAVLLAAKRPENPLEGASYFDRHPAVALSVLAVLAAVIVFPIFVVSSLPLRLFGRRARTLASNRR